MPMLFGVSAIAARCKYYGIVAVFALISWVAHSSEAERQVREIEAQSQLKIQQEIDNVNQFLDEIRRNQGIVVEDFIEIDSQESTEQQAPSVDQYKTLPSRREAETSTGEAANDPTPAINRYRQLPQSTTPNNSAMIERQSLNQSAAENSLPTLIAPDNVNPAVADEANTKVFVFVSTSMPQLSLTQWIAQADAMGTRVVLRGLIDNDMLATVDAIAELVKDNERGGVLIDPTLFDRFAVDQVPAVVVTDTEYPCHDACENAAFDIIYGDAECVMHALIH